MEHATAISMDTPTPTSTLPTPPTSAPLHTTTHTSTPSTTTAHTTALTTPPTPPTQISSPISKPDVLSTRVYAHDRDQDQGRDQEPPSPPRSLETISRTLGAQPLSLPSSRTTRGQAATTKAATDASSHETAPQEQLEKATSTSLGASVAGRVPEAVSDGPGLAHTFTAAVTPAAIAASAPTTAVPTSAPISSATPLSTRAPTTSTTAPITETVESTLPPTPTSFTTPYISSPPVVGLVALVKTPLPSPPMSPVRPTRVEAVNEERREEEMEQERREREDEESDGFDFGEYARFEDESLESHSHQEEQLQPQPHSQLLQQQPQLQLDQQEEQEKTLAREHEHEHEEQRMDERTRIEHWLAQQCRMSMLFGSAEAEAIEQVYLSYGLHPTTTITTTTTSAPGAEGFTLKDEEGGVRDIWAGRGDVDSDEGTGVGGREQWVVPMPVPGEEEGIRADSPLLGFGQEVVGVGRDKPLPPPPRVSSTPTPPPLPAKDPRRMGSALGIQVEVLESPSASPSESPSPVGQTVGLPSLSASLTSTPSSGFTVPSALVAAAGVGSVNNVGGAGQRLQQRSSQQSQQQQQQPSVGRQSPSRQYVHSPSASFSSATQVLLPIGAVASVGVGAATSSTYGYSSTHTYSTPAATHAYTPTLTNVYAPAPAHVHARGAHGGSMSSLSLSLGSGSGSGIGMGVPMSLSRRPSLLRIPSLPLLGEGEVLDVSSGVQATGEEEKVGAEQMDEGPIGIATATAVSSAASVGDADVAADVVGDAGDDSGVYGHARGLGLGLGQEEDGHQNPTMGARRSRFRSQSSSALYHLECSSANNSSTTSNDINSTAGAVPSNANATGTGTSAEIVTPQAMFHLPTAMQNQVRRSRSSQMLLGYSGSSSASLSVLGGEGSAIGTSRSSAVPSRATTPLGLSVPSPLVNAPLSLLNTPSSVSGTLSSMSSSSALLSVVGSHATSTNASPLLLPPSPLPPSAPPTRRSRAGSLSAGAVLGLGLGLGGLGVEGHSADGGRHAHAPSVGSVASSGKGIRDAMYIDSEVVTARLDALLAGAAAEEQRQVQQDEDEEVDGIMEGVLDRWMGGEQEQSARWEDPEPAYPRGASGALGFDPDDDAVNALRTPPPLALSASTYTTPTNARKHHAGVSGTWSSSASVAPPNTPNIPYSPKLVPLHSQQSQHSLKSQKQHQHSHPYPYQNPQASSSQVYVGPTLPQSPGHSSPGHGAHVYGQSLDQQQQQLLLHSRNTSSASSSNNALAVRSRIHSRATSKESSPAPGSPRAVARLERSPSGTHVLVARPHARSVSSSARVAAASGAISIPVPVQLVSAEATGNTRPARPPPAPPLDLNLAAATVRSVVEEEGVGVLGLRDIGMQMQTGLLENSEESYGVRGDEGVAEGGGVLDEVVGVEAEQEQEQEISDDEMDRLQFLRGLRLEDRMEEFRGVDFPSGMDDGFKGGVIDGGAGVYPEEDLGEPVVPHSLQERPAMMRSMSRWSLGSSNADERVENTGVVAKKEKKRKSFVTAFGVSGGGDDNKHTTLPSSTGPTPVPAAGKEKKRGRLASFISRLSGVGSGGTVSSPTTPGGSPGKLPPIPNSPATPGFMSTYASDPFASNMALLMAADELPAVPPVPAGLLPSPMIVDPILRKMKSQESVGGIEVASSVYGVWDPQPSSHAPRKKSVSSSNSAQSIRNQTHPPITTVRPTLATAYSEDVISTMGRKAPHIAWEKDVSGGGWMTERGEKTAVTTGDNAGLTMRARSNTTGDILLLSGAKRPALYKSASASVLGPNGQQMDGRRKTPSAIHTRIQYRGMAVAVDDSMPPTPSSITSTDIEEEDEEEEEEDYGVEVHQRGRIRREQEHEERWAKLRANVDSEIRLRQQEPLPTIPMSPPLPSSSTTTKIESAFKALPLPSSPPAQTSQIVDQRQRLKSMPSLVSVHPSPPASASTTNFSLLPPLISKSSKGSGFRGLVGRMGFGSSSANNTKNNSPVSSHPGTPLTSAPPQSIPSTSTDPSVDGVFYHASHFSGGRSSVSHSPTTSFSQSGSHNDASLYASGAVMGRRPPKRKLVISGVSPGNAKGFQAVKAWCESFGEVKDMSRSPNGDVYVDYKSADVAETVCRVQAKVFIKGAGSVSLSWYTKKRP